MIDTPHTPATMRESLIVLVALGSRAAMTTPSPEPSQETQTPGPPRYFFSCAFYLFGAVIIAPLFALLALKRSDPAWGAWFPQGWVDPALALVVMPILGAIVGVLAVLVANLIYLLVRKKRS